MQMSDVEARFEQLIARYGTDPSVTPPSATGGRTFGASALKVDGKIFAMLCKGELVVKLPRQRVAELLASAFGMPFGSGNGRAMKEWIAIAPSRAGQWVELAEEARQFVAASAGPRRR